MLEHSRISARKGEKMKNKAKDMLLKSNLKVTDTRCLILEVLLENNSPISYEQIKERLSLDKATFYRNMITFEEKGLINKFESKDRVSYYEIGTSSHAHFVCEKCHEIVCFKTSVPFEMEGCYVTSMTLKGYCSLCFKNK